MLVLFSEPSQKNQLCELSHNPHHELLQQGAQSLSPTRLALLLILSGVNDGTCRKGLLQVAFPASVDLAVCRGPLTAPACFPASSQSALCCFYCHLQPAGVLEKEKEKTVSPTEAAQGITGNSTDVKLDWCLSFV